MTGTTAQTAVRRRRDRTPPAAPRLPLALVPAAPGPGRREGPWPPCSASGVATGAGAGDGTASHAAPPRPAPRRAAMARPTVAGKITALSGDDITVETNGNEPR